MGTGDTFESDGFRIAYEDVGDGAPIVLVHGFTSNRLEDWKKTGWFETLDAAGRRVVALDLRGHGESEKRYDDDAYGNERLTADVVRLLDHLSIPIADVYGYSMGGRIAARLLVDHGDRFQAGIVGGCGTNVLGPNERRLLVADALEADDTSSMHPGIRRYREMAERMGNDLDAIAAFERAELDGIDVRTLTTIENPVLVVVGEDDEVAEDVRDVADLIPDGEFVMIPGGDHVSTLSDASHKEAVLEFLDWAGLG